MESCCFYSSSGFSVTKNDNIRRTNSYPKQIVTHLVYFGTQEIQTFWLVQTEKCAHLQKNLNGKNITGCVNDCKNILNTTWKNHKRTFCKYSLQLSPTQTTNRIGRTGQQTHRTMYKPHKNLNKR